MIDSREHKVDALSARQGRAFQPAVRIEHELRNAMIRNVGSGLGGVLELVRVEEEVRAVNIRKKPLEPV